MKNTSFRDLNAVFRSFWEIEATAFQSRIRFFETYKNDLQGLPSEQYFRILVSYLDALFETGAYQRFLRTVEEAIELSVEENILFVNGQDIYHHLLFRKSACFYHVFEYQNAVNILEQLVRLHPHDAITGRFLRKCLVRQSGIKRLHWKAVSISLIILSAMLAGLDVLLLRPFWPEWSAGAVLAWNVILASGILVLLASEGFAHFWSFRRLQHLVQEGLERKRRRVQQESEA